MKPLKYCKQLFFTLGWLGAFSVCSCAQDTLLPASGQRWDYSESRVARSEDGKELQVTFTVKPGGKLKGQEMVCIFPVYASADGKDSVALEPVCVAGKKRYKVMRRRKALHNYPSDQPEMEEIHTVEELENEPLSYEKHVPFERWMAEGHLAVREKVYGCAECKGKESTDTAVSPHIPFFGEKDYAYHFIEPEQVRNEYRKDTLSCRVIFPLDRHDLQQSFADNSQELDRLEKFIQESLSGKEGELRNVHMKGYASPEGELDYNKALADRRTLTLSEYIARKYPELKRASVYQEAGVGEDWEGLKQAVAASSLPEKDEILAIIGRFQTDTEREEAIRQLDGGKTYDKLLKEFYPELRRTTFSLIFDAKPYAAEELPEIFGTKPEAMSLYEMYRLAGMYESKGENPVPVYERAYRQFPGDAAAVLNYANALLKYDRNADGALQVLEEVKGDARSVLPTAIALDMKGDWRKAEEVLKKVSGKK